MIGVEEEEANEQVSYQQKYLSGTGEKMRFYDWQL